MGLRKIIRALGVRSVRLHENCRRRPAEGARSHPQNSKILGTFCVFAVREVAIVLGGGAWLDTLQRA